MNQKFIQRARKYCSRITQIEGKELNYWNKQTHKPVFSQIEQYLKVL